MKLKKCSTYITIDKRPYLLYKNVSQRQFMIQKIFSKAEDLYFTRNKYIDSGINNSNIL